VVEDHEERQGEAVKNIATSFRDKSKETKGFAEKWAMFTKLCYNQGSK
jgi:hypothetical protein